MRSRMAQTRRSTPSLVLGVALLALSACATGTAPPEVAADEMLPSSPPAPSATTSSPVPSDPPSGRPEPSGDRGPGPDGVAISVPPAGVEPVGPIVVLVHGGAWFAGSPALLNGLARALSAEGAVVFNASYDLAGTPDGGYPGSLDDVACAVRFARAEAPAYTDSDELVIVGHSAGAHLAAVVALDPRPWGGDCAYPPADPPDRLVGLAGIYDVRAIGGIFSVFLGGPSSDREARLSAVNPVELAGRQDRLDVVLVTGSEDVLVPASQATVFAEALPDGAEVLEISGAGHADLQYPDVVGLAVILQK